ncbi:hypothetical protein L195_g005541 [Trifolium pratense]|uniref:Uncharacterized protein n=1 Tax=Trifolium pratense TaxID=57577 RepID=A0A2K3P152_TRIPR|nr:hypothetical protein L195_g005541 [Trifolium pratense]
MVSGLLQDLLGHLLSGFRYRITHRLYPRTKLNSDVCEGCVKKSHIGCEMAWTWVSVPSRLAMQLTVIHVHHRSTSNTNICPYYHAEIELSQVCYAPTAGNNTARTATQILTPPTAQIFPHHGIWPPSTPSHKPSPPQAPLQNRVLFSTTQIPFPTLFLATLQ